MSKPVALSFPAPKSLAANEQWCERQLAGWKLGFVLRRSRRKTVGLRINEQGLLLTAPSWLSEQQLDDVLLAKQQWITTKLQAWQQRQAQVSLGQNQWQDKGLVPLLGVNIELRLHAALPKTSFTGYVAQPTSHDRLLLPLSSAADSNLIQDHVERWFKIQAQTYMDTWVQYYVQLSRGRPFSRWRLASPKKRWGSCNSAGVIMLNWRLIHFPPAVIQYVIAHEVAHLKEMNHGPNFWAEVGRLMPNFEAPRQLLRQHSPGHLPTFNSLT